MISEMLWGTEKVYYLHSEPHTIKKFGRTNIQKLSVPVTILLLK